MRIDRRFCFQLGKQKNHEWFLSCTGALASQQQKIQTIRGLVCGGITKQTPKPARWKWVWVILIWKVFAHLSTPPIPFSWSSSVPPSPHKGVRILSGFSSTWAFTACLRVCSCAPFPSPWEACAWDLGVFRIRQSFAPLAEPPDPINHLCSRTGKQIAENYFTYRSEQIFKILFQGFYSPKSDPPHKIMRYWIYYSTQLCFWFPPDRNLSRGNDLYWRCTSSEQAFRRGRPLNILHDS